MQKSVAVRPPVALDRRERNRTRMTEEEKYLKMILRARVYDVAEETPLDFARRLSERLKNEIWLKREDLQPLFSFKVRGAYNKIANLPESVRAGGVVAASAGNHAQGVALGARRLHVRATIVMPRTTPAIKIESVKAQGARIVLFGDGYDEAYGHALEISKKNGQPLLHPFDDPDVIAGQGTIGMEILRQRAGSIDAIFVPIGGGGLIAGIAAYIKALRPEIRIIGVEPEEAPTMFVALERGRRVELKEVGMFADGVAVRMVGRETFKIARRCVDEVILVNTDEICGAIKEIFDDTRSISEPAGALAVAGLKKYVEREQVQAKHLIAVNSGANMNFDRLRHIAERADLGEGREAIFAVTIPEEPGSFRRFCKTIGARNVTEFNYRYSDDRQAHVFVGINLVRGAAEQTELTGVLREAGYQVLDLSGNEMAKLHVRHMVGGRAPQITNEVVYRFEFPERPGALLKFLTAIGHNWNISLFHYRNHGAAYGRVLAGVQVPPKERKRFESYLDRLGYRYLDETDNPARALFLG